MSNLRRAVVSTVLALAACGDAGSSSYVATLEAPGALYAAAQDGDGPWQQLTLDATGRATFAVSRGFHGVTALCGGSYLAVRFDAGDEAAWRPCGAPVAASVTVSGTVNPAAATLWTPYGIDLIDDGEYSLRLPPGRVDLVALAGQRVLIDRDHQLTADVTIDLDLVADGVDLATLTPAITGAGAGTPQPYAEITTANGTWAPTSDGSLAVVPPAHRAAGDQVAIGARLVTGTSITIVQRAVIDATAPTLAFEPLPALSVARDGARWGDGWDFVAIQYPTQSATVRAVAYVLPAWSAASGQLVLPLLDAAALPGWNSAWPWPAVGTAVTVNVRGGIGDLAGDYRSTSLDASVTW